MSPGRYRTLFDRAREDADDFSQAMRDTGIQPGVHVRPPCCSTPDEIAVYTTHFVTWLLAGEGIAIEDLVQAYDDGEARS